MKPVLRDAMAAQFGLALQAAPPPDLAEPLPVAVAATSTQAACAVRPARFPVAFDSRAGRCQSGVGAGGGGEAGRRRQDRALAGAVRRRAGAAQAVVDPGADRKSDVVGTSVSVRVHFGVRRIIN